MEYSLGGAAAVRVLSRHNLRLCVLTGSQIFVPSSDLAGSGICDFAAANTTGTKPASLESSGLRQRLFSLYVSLPLILVIAGFFADCM